MWELSNIGAERAPRGIRDLEAEGDGVLSLIAGGLDKEVLRDRDREGAKTFVHWQVRLPPGGRAHADEVRVIEDVERVEGVARDPRGGYVYVSDDKKRVVVLS